MKTVTISSKGQISLPKEIRKALQLKEGDKLVLEMKEGKILLEPVLNIPRSQAWFWEKNIQDQLKHTEIQYQRGNYQRYQTIEKLTAALKNE